MARIRTIKPEFWGDEKLAPLSPIDRLVFVGLISMADDAGRLVDNVKSIDGFIFPDTEDSSRESLDILAKHSRIVRYESASGQRLIQVANWQRHQKVDKPSRYVLPSPEESSRDGRDVFAESSRSDLGPTTNDLGPTTDDHRSSTSEQQQATTATRDELVAKLGHSETASRTVDDFLDAAPPDKRFAWARGLVAMLEPLGGQRVRDEALLLAMQDFLVADRKQWPFMGRVFRAFVDDASRPKRERHESESNPTDALTQWARETEAREAKEKAHV